MAVSAWFEVPTPVRMPLCVTPEAGKPAAVTRTVTLTRVGAVCATVAVKVKELPGLLAR